MKVSKRYPECLETTIYEKGENKVRIERVYNGGMLLTKFTEHFNSAGEAEAYFNRKMEVAV